MFDFIRCITFGKSNYPKGAIVLMLAILARWKEESILKDRSKISAGHASGRTVAQQTAVENSGFIISTTVISSQADSTEGKRQVDPRLRLESWYSKRAAEFIDLIISTFTLNYVLPRAIRLLRKQIRPIPQTALYTLTIKKCSRTTSSRRALSTCGRATSIPAMHKS